MDSADPAAEGTGRRDSVKVHLPKKQPALFAIADGDQPALLCTSTSLDARSNTSVDPSLPRSVMIAGDWTRKQSFQSILAAYL